MPLHNRIDRRVLRQQAIDSETERVTFSFYRYVRLPNPFEFRDHLYRALDQLSILGRIYVAEEGVNAQGSVPQGKWHSFIETLRNINEFKDIEVRKAARTGLSFIKLAIKVKRKLVADGLAEDELDLEKAGRHLSAAEFNTAIEQGATIVDMRNHYESEIGHFENALCPDVDTFRESLPVVRDLLDEHRDRKILLYCTGGIRCEKASAYLRQQGFSDINQLRGGIIDYYHQVKEQKLANHFTGRNFVFDERLGEDITDDILSECHLCGTPWNRHTNCKNDACHLLFIQCPECQSRLNGCCSDACARINSLPEDEQVKLRREANIQNEPKIYRSRRRMR